MKKLLLLLFLSSKLFAQNLVINPSFETVVNMPCQGLVPPYYIDQIFETWSTPNASAVLFNVKYNNCSEFFWNGVLLSCCDVPLSFGGGFQNPRTGNNYINLEVFANFTTVPNYTEYFQGKLANKLIKNKYYCGGFFINLANTTCNLANGVGMSFIENKIDTGRTNPWYYVHLDYLNYQVKIPENVWISDTLNWVQVSSLFQSNDGGEEYLVVGQYLPLNQIQGFSFLNCGSGTARYNFDDIFLYEQKPIWVYDGDVTICDTITYVLRAEQAPEFVWWNINNPNVWLSTRDTLALPPGVGGTYVVRGEACGYVTYDTVTVTRLNCGLGMPGNANDDDLATIFPNPTSTAFTLKLSQETHTGGTLHINDVNGRQLASHRITQSNQTISSESLAPGLYALAYEYHGRILWRGKLCVMR